MDFLNRSVVTKRKSSVISAGLLVLGMTLLNACGSQSSDSLRSYSKVRNTMGPVHNKTSPTQTYVPTDLFLLELDPTTPPNFTVGQKNVLRFRTALNLKGAKYSLVSRDLPREANKLKDLGQGIWEFSWTPSPELIPHNVNEAIRGKFHVALEIYDVTDLQSQSLAQTLATEREVHYTLLRSGLAPEITDISGIAPYPQVTKLNEGDVLNLVITVKDPASSQAQKPKLIPLAIPNRFNKNREVIAISGHGFLFLETEPTMIQPGIWQFKALFDTKNNSVPEFNIEGQQILTPTVIADLSLQVLSPSRTVSVEKNLTFEITYRRELLKPAFKANPEAQSVSQTATWSYSFESYLPSRVGSLSTFLADETTKLPGTPKLVCKTNKKQINHQSCKIDWKVPCSVTPGEIDIKVVAAAEYQGQNTSTELIKKLTISEHKKCLAPAATGTTAPPPSVAAAKTKKPSVKPAPKKAAPAKSSTKPETTAKTPSTSGGRQ